MGITSRRTSQILKIPAEEAENVKRRYGAALPELADQDLTLEITTSSGSTHAITAFELSRIIKPRLAEIFGMIRDEIDQTLGPVELVANGVILTGGAALLRGTPELARDRFRLPVRVGRPRGIGGLTDIVSGPGHAGSVGLVLYGMAEDGRLPHLVYGDMAPAGAPAAPQVTAPAPTTPEVPEVRAAPPRVNRAARRTSRAPA